MPQPLLARLHKCLLLVSLCLFAGTSDAQKLVSIALTPTSGYGPLEKGSTFLWPLERQPTATRIPPELRDVRIRSFDLQPAQTYYAQYRAHALSKDQFRTYLQETGVDTLQLLKKDSFRHQVAVLAGYRQEAELTLIVDANNNQDFTDDAPHYYPLNLTKAAELAAMKTLPAVRAHYDYFDGRTIVPRTTVLVLNPYKGSLQVTLSTTDLIEKKLVLRVSVPNYQAGTVTLQRKLYRVALSNDFTASTYTKANSKLLLTPSSGQWPTTKDTPAYRVGDIITLEHNQYRFASVSLWGDTIRLESLGYAVRPEGISEGLYLPRFTAHTVDNQAFDLAQVQGKYVLLDFWGTWCGPCIAAFPKLRDLQARFQHANFMVVGIAYDDSLATVKRFLSQNPLTWPTIYQAQQARENNLVEQFQVRAFPTTILLDPTGKIIARGKELNALLPLLVDKLK
jgi:thiol-disulfide isomerase/thioredoxin